MDKKMPKKISLKDFGMEKIILIAIAGIVLLAANFSEWKNSSSKTSEKQEKSIETSQNDAYVEALENKLVHILENVDGVSDIYGQSGSGILCSIRRCTQKSGTGRAIWMV